MQGPRTSPVHPQTGDSEERDAHLPLDDEVAIVTGAGRRIGRAIAAHLALAGADVVVHHRTSTSAAEATAQDIARLGQRAWTLHGDLSHRRDAEDLIHNATEAAGQPPTLLVNNASCFPQGTLDELTLDDFLSTMQVNAWAPVALTRALSAGIDRGAVVNLLDARVGHPDRTSTAYALSKDVLASLTRLMAIEFAPRLRVNAVAPGPILPPSGGSRERFDQIARATPLGWHGEPEDVAQAVVHLLAAPYTTGAILPVSGGQHLLPGVHPRG